MISELIDTRSSYSEIKSNATISTHLLNQIQNAPMK